MICRVVHLFSSSPNEDNYLGGALRLCSSAGDILIGPIRVHGKTEFPQSGKGTKTKPARSFHQQDCSEQLW